MNFDSEIDELHSLLIQWEDKGLDFVDQQRLHDILNGSEEARVEFARAQALSAALRIKSELGIGHAQAPDSNKKPSSTDGTKPALDTPNNSWNTLAIVSLAASLLFCIVVGRWAYLEFASPSNERSANRDNTASTNPSDSVNSVSQDSVSQDSEPTSRGVALLTRVVDTEVRQSGKRLLQGQAIDLGQVEIGKGLAQIEFFCGATVVVEGPSLLNLKSVDRAEVLSGRLRANVPPVAKGFTLTAADLRVVDLGTEFGLAINGDDTSVEVFDGEVELHLKGNEMIKLTQGQAIDADSSGEINPRDMEDGKFVDLNSLAQRQGQQQTMAYQRWRNWSEKFAKDNRIIAYYRFANEDINNRRLSPNKASTISENATQIGHAQLEGAIVGTTKTIGRWPQKSALNFKRPGDRVRLTIDGEYSSLTFMAWVRIDSLDRWYNSLFLTDNYNEGEPHWQILDSGQLFFSARIMTDAGQGPAHRKVLSPSFWSPSLSGQWIHLATTFDVDSATVTHFLNGESMHQETIPDHQLVRTTRFGDSTIGNWTSPQRPDKDFAIRNLNGSIDEFTILNEAINATEIKQIYEIGKP